MSDSRQALPLKPEVERGSINGVAWDLNWLMVDVLQKSDEQPYEKIYATGDSKTKIHYIEDFFIGMHYVLAVGPAARTVIEGVSERLDAYDWKDVEALFSVDSLVEERVQAVYAAAILAPSSVDPDRLRFFERVAEDGEERVRLALSIGIGYIGWEACRDLARDLANDPSERIRKNAELMIEGFEKGLHRSE